MTSDSGLKPPGIAEIAADLTALCLAGKFHVAGEKYWSPDVMRITPPSSPDESPAICSGIEAVRAGTLRWLTTHGIEDLSLDGPFVTGDHFALFADMLIAHRGRRTPHSRIAVFAVRDGKIIEERYFHD